VKGKAMVKEEYQGRSFEPYYYEVDRSKIRELALACDDRNPLFSDTDYALSKGYRDTPAPLTFATVMTFWGNPKIWEIMKEIGIDLSKMFHMREEYEYFSEIYPRDVLTGRVTVDSVRATDRMDMVVFRIDYLRDDEPVVTSKMSVVVVNKEA
jgi:hypothetical protein